MKDLELLRHYEKGDQHAFSELVELHVNAVYSTSFRILQNSQLAEEVSQDCFCLLARKAPLLREDTVIIAWLHRAAWNIAQKKLRGEQRRRVRELQSASPDMNDLDQKSVWKEIAPILDEGIEGLNEGDRRAILLRFFETRPSREIGLALGVSEEAARARVSRAVEKLRHFFKQRGVTLTSASLVALLTSQMGEAAPASLILTIKAAAKAVSQSVTPLSAALKLLYLTLHMKLKTAVITGAIILLGLILADQVTNRGTRSFLFNQTEPVATMSAGSMVASHGAKELRERFARYPAQAKKAEIEGLKKVYEILYSPDRDEGLPPHGMAEAIKAEGSMRREALDLLLEAIKSGDTRAAGRAASSLQTFKDFATELIPKILAFMKSSTNAEIISLMAGTGAFLNEDGKALSDVVDAFKSNPAAAEGVDTWMDIHLMRHKDDAQYVIQVMLPLLSSDNAQQRLIAALVLSRTSMNQDLRLTPALITGLETPSNSKDYLASSGIDMRAGELLKALQTIGPLAKEAAPAVKEYGRRFPMWRRQVNNTLASIAPDLRTEIPEVDKILKGLEAAAEMDSKLKAGNADVSTLLAALKNPEGRIKAAEAIGALGNAGMEALPQLRAILKNAESDKSPDGPIFLNAVTATIRKLDPTAPAYYSVQLLGSAMSNAMEDLRPNKDPVAQGLRDSLMDRCGSPRPFTQEEIGAWAKKIRAVDPQISKSFVKRVSNSGYSNLKDVGPYLRDQGLGEE